MVTPLLHTRACCWIFSHHILVCSNGGDMVQHEVSTFQRMASPKMAALVMIRGIQQCINRKGSLTRRLRRPRDRAEDQCRVGSKSWQRSVRVTGPALQGVSPAGILGRAGKTKVSRRRMTRIHDRNGRKENTALCLRKQDSCRDSSVTAKVFSCPLH